MNRPNCLTDNSFDSAENEAKIEKAEKDSKAFKRNFADVKNIATKNGHLLALPTPSEKVSLDVLCVVWFFTHFSLLFLPVVFFLNSTFRVSFSALQRVFVSNPTFSVSNPKTVIRLAPLKF